MGEYATYQGREIKIGTCEQMYYLRADQVHLIGPLRGNVNPRKQSEAESIRFRFPFPQEDGKPPGSESFPNHDYGLGLYGIEPPLDKEIEHYSVHFSNNGLMVSMPCPRSRLWKIGREAAAKLGIKAGYNGYAPVHIHSQRLVEGKLVLILRCGDCGALYRMPNLEEAKPVLAVLEELAADSESGRDYYDEIARRIIAGYTEPNFWTEKQLQAA